MKTKIAQLYLLAILAGLFGGFLALKGGAALADTGSGSATVDAAPATPPAIDAPAPDTDPIGFGGKVLQLYRAGALVPAVLLALFGVAVFLRARFGWFKTGKQAVYVAAAVTALTMLAEPASRGTTPNIGMILAALAAAVALWLHHPEAS